MSARSSEHLAVLCNRHRPNSIGFLRFLFAAMVLFSHSYGLGGFGFESDPLLHLTSVETLGDLGVSGFFVLSGFLIAHSYVQTRSPLRFLWHRVLRIFPAFWACLVVTAFVFAPLLHWFGHAPHTLRGFWSSAPTPLAYISQNALLDMRTYRIGDLLHSNPYPDTLDGALWTLILEFRCYLGLGLLGILGLLTRRRRLGLAVVALLLIALMLKNSVVPTLWPALSWLWGDGYGGSLKTWFCAGVLAYLVADKVPLRWPLFLLAALAFAVAMNHKAAYRACGPILLVYVLLFLANKLPLSWWDRPGDFSYGLYIYAFPIQQILAFFGVRRGGVWGFAGPSLAIAMVFAWLSYRLVEERCLRLKNLWRAQPIAALDESAA